MNTKNRAIIWIAALSLFSGLVLAQATTPLGQPLENFDKLISNLKVSSVLGQPIQVGDTTIIPFAKISFGLGGGGAMMAFGGGMGGKTIPLGILVVEGENVRVELFPEEEKKPSFLQEMLPVLLQMVPQFMGGKFPPGAKPPSAAPGPEKPPSAVPLKDASLDMLKKLFEQKNYAEALEMADALIAKEPNNGEYHVWKGHAMGRLAQGNPADMMKYGLGAMQEYETALQLDPENSGGHFGRGMTRLYTGDLDGAIADFEFASAKDPLPEASYYLGEAYKKKGLTDKARAAYKKALELKPDYAPAAKALAELK
jgi:uncharacterized spore protein YtfJ/Flp pilus assembly protein TadD